MSVSTTWFVRGADDATQPPRKLLNRCSGLTDARFATFSAGDASKIEALASNPRPGARAPTPRAATSGRTRKRRLRQACRGARADTLAYADQCIEISSAAITWYVLRVASLVKLQRKRKATAAIGGIEKIIAA